jgi:hypothetical protein
MLRFFFLILILPVATALFGQIKSSLSGSETELYNFLNDTSLKVKWRNDVSEKGENRVKISQTFLLWNNQSDSFKIGQGEIWRARLLSILGQPDSIAKYQNSKEYCNGWRQEYLYFIVHKPNAGRKSKNKQQLLTFVFDQCEKNLMFVELRTGQ